MIGIIHETSPFLIAGYLLTWGVLGAYSFCLFRRLRHAKRGKGS